MLTIKVEGLAELRKSLEQFSDRRFNAAIATALTRTAVAGREKMQAEMRQNFDRPTPYTMRAMRYIGASADRLEAYVGLDVQAVQDVFGNVQSFARGETPASEYMLPQVTGGPRKLKRLEVALQAIKALPQGYFVVPGQGARLDAYGNVSRGQIIQVLSQLRVQLVAGTSRNMSTDARRQLAAQRKAGGRFFVAPVGGRTQPGIYQRELIGRNVTPVFIFVKATTYRQRWDFAGSMRKFAQAELPKQIGIAVQQHIERLAKRGAR